MELSDTKLKEISRRVMVSRMRILVNNGFYGLLLMHMKISLSTRLETAWTDCMEHIFFNPNFVNRLSDKELDYVFMHEILHVVLRHCERKSEHWDDEQFNIAADIIVNSNILKSNSGDTTTISLKEFGGEQMHLAPDGSEGHMYTVEELYNLLGVTNSRGSTSEKVDGKSLVPNLINNSRRKSDNKYKSWDFHISNKDQNDKVDDEYKARWTNYIKQAYEVISIQEANKQRGTMPVMIDRIIDALKKPQIDWRQLLVEFIQDEVNDYSFMPPDRRFDDSLFFLPDFNDRELKPGNILFAVDCSGSMSDEEISSCYTEIKGAIDQFDGKLEGLLGFFDMEFTKPIEFSSVDDLLAIKPVGDGGTSFDGIFKYLEELEEDELPNTIVILTDGFAPYPDEKLALGIPVLWVVNNDRVSVPWGRVARIEV